MKKFFWTMVLLACLVGSCRLGMSWSDDHEAMEGPGIRVIRLEGEIIDGRKWIEKLRKAMDDSAVKAVVLRIESPGGAVGASQEIYAAVRELDKTKPVVASIGNIGASGGYYAALGARRIWALPGSITGSIGVISQFTQYHELLEKIGVSSEVVKSGEMKDAGSPMRTMTEKEKALFQAMISDVYAQFREVVRERRKLDSVALDTLADGRVFSGRQAWKARLVDSTGTLQESIEEARRLAKLDKDAPVDDDLPKQPVWKQFLDPQAEGLSQFLPLGRSRVELRIP
ncbi:MAG: signal peptide peptidase SppA [Fibrobacterota bacterium]